MCFLVKAYSYIFILRFCLSCFFKIKIYFMLAHYSVSRCQGLFIVLNCQKYMKKNLTGNCMSIKFEILVAYEI